MSYRTSALVTLGLVASVSLTLGPGSQAVTSQERVRSKDKPEGVAFSVPSGTRLRVAAPPGSGRFLAVRLRGIRAPQPHQCGGIEARARLVRLTSPDGQGEFLGLRRRRLALSGRERLGSGMTLVDAHLPDGRNLAKLQLAEGWASVRTRELSGRQLESFRAVALRAREEDRGVWALCAGDFASEAPDRGGSVFE